MFDIGGWEFLVIAVLAIIVIGPKDLPGTVRTVAQWARKARNLAREFQSGLDEMARDVDIDNLGNDISAGVSLDGIENPLDDVRREIEDAVDPGDEIEEAADKETMDEGDEFFDGPLDDTDDEQEETAAVPEAEDEADEVIDAPEADQEAVADAAAGAVPGAVPSDKTAG
jgi:sec-independent protein translocase protein TatB